MIENLDPAQMLNTYVVPWGINISMAIIIFIVGRLVVKFAVSLLRKFLVHAKMDHILVNFLSAIVSTILLLFVVIASLDQLGVNTTSLIALIGAAGLAIGLALQGSLQNFASGVMLVVFRPFNDGDFIDAGGVMGVVEHIGIFSTTLRTGDNKQVIMPNGAIYGGPITNYSAKATRRVDMVFGIGYDDDIRKARDIMKGIIDADERILKEPETLIAVAELADSSVNFNVRPWVKSEDYWPVLFDLNEKIKLAFDDNGITIPYPQMDVHTNTTT